MSQIRQGHMKSSMLRQGNTGAIPPVEGTARLKRLPVVNFAAGGISTPGTCCLSDLRSGFNRSSPSSHIADAALMMQLGCDGGASINRISSKLVLI